MDLNWKNVNLKKYAPINLIFSCSDILASLVDLAAFFSQFDVNCALSLSSSSHRKVETKTKKKLPTLFLFFSPPCFTSSGQTKFFFIIINIGLSGLAFDLLNIFINGKSYVRSNGSLT